VSGDNAPASEIVISVVFAQLRISDEKIPSHISKFIIDYQYFSVVLKGINPLNAELNPICYLLALLGAHHFLHVSRIRINK